jgi:hypothetical protein
MAKKIEIVGNALQVTDTVSGIVEISQPKSETWYDEAMLQAGTVKFISRKLFSAADEQMLYPQFALADAVDSVDAPFTESTLRTFNQTNLGF